MTSILSHAIISFIFLFTYEYIIIVRKLTFKGIVSLYPNLLPETDSKYRLNKIEISQLTNEQKKDYRVVVNNLEAEVSKHTQLFKTLSFVLTEGQVFSIVGHLNSGNRELCRKIGGLDRYVLGEVTINGYDLRTQRKDAQKQLSISLQHGRISCSMSGYEYLEVICYCRGIRDNKIFQMIIDIFDMLYMKDVMFHPISSYNANNILKLSLAETFIGDISVMILDQPTSGLDPISKIATWNVIRYARSLGKTIIFSTDALNEAELLSDMMLFLVDGNIVGLSTPMDVRISASKGIYVEFRMAFEGKTHTEAEEKLSMNLATIRQFFHYLSNSSKELKSLSSGVYLYFMPMPVLDWVKVMSILESNKTRLGIYDYIVETRSLKDIMYKIDDKF